MAFQRTQYFPELDGLRAISILLVVSLHTADPLWAHLHGTVGVTIFFVISGFLITTLLQRDEVRRGRASLRGFYIRRAFRILPLYYLILAVYAVLLLLVKAQAGGALFQHELPYFLTYNNEFANVNVKFDQTWSLAVEEKFYLFWPLIAFAMPVARRHRGKLIGAIAIFSVACRFAGPPLQYFSLYIPIALGCLLALVMHDERTFILTVRMLTGRVSMAVLVTTSLVLLLAFESDHTRMHVVFSALAALAIPGVLVGPYGYRRLLRSRAMVFIGSRSYAIYLIHRICKNPVDHLFSPGTSSALREVIRLVLIVSLSVALSDVLYRLCERPLIRVGRRLTGSHRDLRSVPSEESAACAVPG